jgi:hypothetical protein
MKPWQLDILISSDGFKGIQIINADPSIIKHVLGIMPLFRGILLELDHISKSIGEEYDECIS